MMMMFLKLDEFHHHLKGMRLALSNVPYRVVTFIYLYPVMEIESLSEMCIKIFKIKDNVQNNSDDYRKFIGVIMSRNRILQCL
jgi:hypothetical protein